MGQKKLYKTYLITISNKDGKPICDPEEYEMDLLEGNNGGLYHCRPFPLDVDQFNATTFYNKSYFLKRPLNEKLTPKEAEDIKDHFDTLDQYIEFYF